MNIIFAILSLLFLSIKFEIIRDKNWFINYTKINKQYGIIFDYIDLKDNYPLFLFFDNILYLIYIFSIYCLYPSLSILVIILLSFDIIKRYLMKLIINDDNFYLYCLFDFVIHFALLILILLKLILCQY